MGDADRPTSSLEIPPGVPFGQPEHETFTWDVALDADDLIGLLGTFSWFITMPDETRGCGDRRSSAAARSAASASRARSRWTWPSVAKRGDPGATPEGPRRGHGPRV